MKYSIGMLTFASLLLVGLSVSHSTQFRNDDSQVCDSHMYDIIPVIIHFTNSPADIPNEPVNPTAASYTCVDKNFARLVQTKGKQVRVGDTKYMCVGEFYIISVSYVAIDHYIWAQIYYFEDGFYYYTTYNTGVYVDLPVDKAKMTLSRLLSLVNSSADMDASTKQKITRRLSNDIADSTMACFDMKELDRTTTL
jgi:hypothetical protein